MFIFFIKNYKISADDRIKYFPIGAYCASMGNLKTINLSISLKIIGIRWFIRPNIAGFLVEKF